MNETKDKNQDLSSSLIWIPLAPIEEITDANAAAVIDWLTDRSSVLIWFTSIVSGALMVLTLFGNKPGLQDLNSTALSISLLMMFFSILCNLMCVWQIPKWKLAIRTGRISNGRRMTLELEISSWLGLVSFLGALVMAALGNSGL